MVPSYGAPGVPLILAELSGELKVISGPGVIVDGQRMLLGLVPASRSEQLGPNVNVYAFPACRLIVT
jgi:hypothetical protein